MGGRGRPQSDPTPPPTDPPVTPPPPEPEPEKHPFASYAGSGTCSVCGEEPGHKGHSG